MPSLSLLHLLHYAKRSQRDAGWRGVAMVLAPLYSSQMRLLDVLAILLRSYDEALAEPRFELTAGRTAMEELVFAPVRGLHAVAPFGGGRLESQYSVEQFYDAMVGHVLGQLAICRVDWCRENLDAIFAPLPVRRMASVATTYSAHR